MSLMRVAFAGLLLVACTGEPEWEERAAIDGRTFVEDGDLVMGFPATGLRFRAEGEVVLNVMAEGDLVALEIREDDGPWKTHRLPRGENRLAVNTDGTPSDVRIVKVSEDWQGPLRVTAMEGETAPLPAPSGPRLLFIGDSITAGSGTDLAALERGELDKAGDNARLSFPQFVAERLDADVHQIAYGGRGIIRDWENKTYEEDGQLNAPQFFERAAPGYDVAWEHCDWVPDAVVIGLGTNDFNPGIPDATAFTDAMVDFVEDVQAVANPGAPVLLMVSPMFGEGSEKREIHKDYLQAAAERIGPDARVVDVGYHPGHPSALHHPVASEHEAMADILAKEISTRLADNVRETPAACAN